MRTVSRICAYLGVVASLISSAAGLEPTVHITQYAHSVWRTQEGSLGGRPASIAQTKDGYLWIGTNDGLVRFDGIRFVPWLREGPRLPDSSIYSLKGSSDGALWIGTSIGLSRWKDSQLVTFPLVGRVNRIIEDHTGKVWIARTRTSDSNGGFCQVGDSIHCFGMSDGMTMKNAALVAEDRSGALWVGSADQLLRWNHGPYQTYFAKELKSSSGLAAVETLEAAADGSIWTSISRKGLGLQHIVDGVPSKLAVTGMDPAEISAMRTDDKGVHWVGTFNHGLYRLYGKQVEHFGVGEGLSGNTVNDLFLDRAGGLWVATSQGLDYFHDKRVLTYSSQEGFSTDYISSVVAAKDGTIWAGNYEELNFIRDSQVGAIRQKDKLPGKLVGGLWEDHAGRLWVGVDHSLYIYSKGRFREIFDRDHHSLGICRSIAEDHDHNIWVATTGAERRVYRVRDFQVQESFSDNPFPLARVIAPDPVDGVWLGFGDGELLHYRNHRFEAIALPYPSPVRSISAEPDGSVWVAKTEGILLWKNGKVHTLNTANGLPCDSIAAALMDAQSNLWILASCGVIEVSHQALTAWERNPQQSVEYRLFDRFDGAQPAATTFQPTISRAFDGKLWFANDTVLQMIDPGNLKVDKYPPPVSIERIVADRKEYPVGKISQLPPLTRDLEINYTALCFLIPERVHFRYRLEGRDKQWQEAGSRREAFYNDLPPGKYRFQVIAANSDGVWNMEGASFEFSVLPAFYQTFWFRGMTLAMLIAMLGLAYRFRMTQIAKEMNTRFEERLAERTRMARDLHDTLLQTIQGSKLVLEDALTLPAERSSQLRQSLEKVSDWLGRAIHEGRAAIQALRTPVSGENHLSEALRQVAEACQIQSSIRYELRFTGTDKALHPTVRDEAYQIGYEAIRNACQHSGGSLLTIELSYTGDFLLRIRDNGTGIGSDVARKGTDGHFGVVGMYERASRLRAKLTIGKLPGGGTEVELIVPRSIAFSHLARMRRKGTNSLL